jgi:hypothetical protein
MNGELNMRDIGELNENSLKEAVECISNTIDAALEACFNNEEEWSEIRKEIFDSWALICAFGDLEERDGTDGFGEFMWHYNEIQRANEGNKEN